VEQRISGIFHLPCYAFDLSNPRDDDLQEERFLSAIISGVPLPKLRQIVVPSKPIDTIAQKAKSPRSVRLWKESREVLRENERIKSGRVKLRTLEVGETGV